MDNGVILLLGLMAGLGDILGGYLTVIKRVSRRTVARFIALGAGFLLGGAFFEVLPEAIEAVPEAPMYVALGYFTIFVIEHTFAHSAHGHHYHEEHDPGGRTGDEVPSLSAALLAEHRRTPHVLVGEPHGDEPEITGAGAWAAMVGLVIHTFFDGAAIGIGFMDSQRLGILVFIAVMLHKLPEGFSLSSIMLAAGQSRLRAFLATSVIAGSTLAGTMAAVLTGASNPNLTGVMLSLAAGSFIYIGATDLIPAAIGRRRSGIFLVLLGAAIVYVLSTVLHSLGLE